MGSFELLFGECCALFWIELNPSWEKLVWHLSFDLV